MRTRLEPTLLLLMAVVLALVLTPSPRLALEIIDGITDQVLVRYPIDNQGDLTLAYTHSMYGGRVRETFVVEGSGRLLRVDFRAARAAAAEYYAYTAPIRHEGEWYVVDIPSVELAELPVEVDGVGSPTLQVGGKEVSLLEEVGSEGRMVVIRPIHLPRLAGLYIR